MIEITANECVRGTMLEAISVIVSRQSEQLKTTVVDSFGAHHIRLTL
jgi:hypothetical protein